MIVEAAVVVDRERVEEAFVYAEHDADQRRRSGEDFIIPRDAPRPKSCARCCCTTRVDGQVGVVEEVHEAFGEEVAGLVDGVTKLTGFSTFHSRDEAQAETTAR